MSASPARPLAVRCAAVRLVLASASPARLGLLRDAGVDPLVRVSGVDEDAVAAALHDPSPAETVAALAAEKALAVVPDVEAPAVVVGCDSMLHVGGRLVGKPGTVDVARARWRAMAGGTGKLLTGHAVVRVDGPAGPAQAVRTVQGVCTTTVRFGDPTPEELEAYLDSGEPLAVAGGFTVDGLGGWFVEGVDGDPSSVVGLSLPLTRRLLAEVGVSVVTLWKDNPLPPR